MENSSTVRIDLQRLQILNDRLCQTLEALNQVRMSCQGVHTHPTPQPNTGYGLAPTFAYGYPQQNFWGAGTAVNPYFTNSMMPTWGPWNMASTANYANPGYGTPVYAQPFAPQMAPMPGYGPNGFDHSRSFMQPTVW